MNRREWLVGGVSGAAIGSAWVAGFGLLLRRQEPTLSVIGIGESILALLDAGNVRVLVVAGPGDPRLSRNLNALLGVFRPRIDLLVGSESGIAEFTSRLLARHGSPRRMILDQPTGISYGSQTATGPPVLLTHLPQGVEIRLSVSIQGAWQAGDTPSQSWIVTIGAHGHQCAIADTSSVLERYGDPAVDVGVVGQIELGNQGDMLRKSALALIAPEDQVEQADTADSSALPILLFPRHPVTITFRQEGLAIRT